MHQSIQRRILLFAIVAIAPLSLMGASLDSPDINVTAPSGAGSTFGDTPHNTDLCRGSENTGDKDEATNNEESTIDRSLEPAEPEPNGVRQAKPVRFRIPALDVDTVIEPVGIADNGNMAEPSEWNDVGWFQPGPRPGAKGNAVIAGHYDSPTGPAVFYRIDKLKAGDEIIVEMDDETELRFRVVETMVVESNEAPLQRIFGPSSKRNLNLITCYGVFDRERNLYDERLVVFTELVAD